MKTSSICNSRDKSLKSQIIKFDWPVLREAVGFYERECLCYLPAGWGHKKPSVKWEEYQNRLPSIEERPNGSTKASPPTSVYSVVALVVVW